MEAGYLVAIADIRQLRHGGGAGLEYFETPRMKDTAVGGINRAGDFSLEDDDITFFLHGGVGDRDGGEKGLSVGVEG
jgi:hypothetical protein